MKIRRCSVLWLEPREVAHFDLDALLAGGTGVVSAMQWFAHAPQLPAEVEIDAAEAQVLGSLSPTDWVDRKAIALENAEAVFGLQLGAIQDRANATFAFFGEAAQARDLDAFKTLLPKGVQVARENLERAVATGQDVYGRTLKANEAIGQITKSQLETVVAKTQASVEEATDKVVKASKAK